jgi:hypothetical protein
MVHRLQSYRSFRKQQATHQANDLLYSAVGFLFANAVLLLFVLSVSRLSLDDSSFMKYLIVAGSFIGPLVASLGGFVGGVVFALWRTAIKLNRA